VISLVDARGQVIEACEPLGGERVSILDAVGRALTAPVLAQHPYPNADVSAMDGYAIRASDASEVGARLAVIGESRAGGPWSGPMGPKEAVRIFTGAILPSDADAIVIQEDTRASEGQVEVLEVPRPGAHIRRLGEGHRPGENLLDRGTKIGPAAVGLLISDGHEKISVHRRPRVAILGTGDELLAPGARPERPGSVVDGNGPMIASFVTQRGAVTTGSERSHDDPAAIARWLTTSAAQADLVLTTGGASVGDHDCIAESWSMAGIETRFWKVAVKPGKPLRFGLCRIHDRIVPVLALPGNPLAVLSALEQIVGPALDHLSGHPGRVRPRVRVPLVSELTKRGGRAHLVRGALTERGFEPARAQGSHLLGAAARRGDVGHLHRDLERLEAGGSIEVEVDPEALSGQVLRPTGPSPHALCITGDSNSGKTQLVEALVRGFRSRGFRVGTVKHATHAVDLDTPGKDSWRHAEAGAEVVVLVGPEKSAVFRTGALSSRHQWFAPLEGEVDWVIIEGFRESPLPCVEVVTGERTQLERLDSGVPRWRLTRSGALGDEVAEPLIDELLATLNTP
jgi:molybdopterin molybdotransferase